MKVQLWNTPEVDGVITVCKLDKNICNNWVLIKEIEIVRGSIDLFLEIQNHQEQVDFILNNSE